MLDQSIDLLRIEPGAAPFWPEGWPENIGIIARLANGRVEELFPFHAEEERDAPLLRAAGRFPPENVGVSPDTEGWNTASGSVDETALRRLALAIGKDPSVLEQASDFAMNFDYARSEGKEFLLSPKSAITRTVKPADEVEVARKQALASDAVPIDEIWMLPGASLHPVYGLSDVLALNIPGGDAATVRNPETFVYPDRECVSITLPAGSSIPNDILLNRKILDFLPATELPAPLRAMRRGNTIEFTIAEPVLVKPGEAMEQMIQSPRPETSRSFAASVLLIVLGVIVLGVTSALVASLVLGLSLEDIMAWGRSFLREDVTGSLDDLRNGLFQAAEATPARS